MTYKSNPRIAWNQKIANEYSTFFAHVHVWLLNKNQISFSFFSPFFLFPFPFLKDIDECKTYPGKCRVNATCNNTKRSHVCKCKPGYTGDGRDCTSLVDNLRSLQTRFDYYNEFLLLLSLVVCLLLFVCLFLFCDAGEAVNRLKLL